MITTLKDVLDRAANESADRTVLRFKQNRQWWTYSYRELRERARRVAQICSDLGVQPGDRVALHRENSPEWFEIYFGIVGMGAIAVPVDVKLREQEVAHIFHDCGVSLVFGSAKNQGLLKELQGDLPFLHTVVLIGGSGDDSYEQLMERTKDEGAYDRHDPVASDPASFIYTSGTTGRQKGAMLSHGNFVANAISCQKAIEIRRTDNFMLVLPLHHAFAFTTSLLLPVLVQCEVSLVENLKMIKPDMLDASPTVLLAVPLLLEKMLARIQDGIQKQAVARTLMKLGLSKRVGKVIHRELGGALRLIVSGGAPIAPATLREWSKLGFAIVEGYGITETAPVLAFNPPWAPRVGTVGLPLPDVDIQILNPDAAGSGEIVVNGPNVMQGYYNNPEATAECLRDGWFHTGDLGYFDEAGYLVVNGRKKSLIVNREGKNIYPEEVEQQINKSPYVMESLALGYREPGETAGERVGLIVVPNQAAFDALEAERGHRLPEQEIEEIIRAEVHRLAQDISSYKRPRCVQIRYDELEKTTTAKIKRYLYAIDTSAL